MVIFERPWKSEEVPEDWKKEKCHPYFQKGQEWGPGNYWPVSLTSVSGKVMEYLILEAISACMNDRKVILNSQHGFTKDSALSTNIMGSALGKSKRLIYKKIRAVIEYQGHKYDKASLKALATWINSHQLQIPEELNLEHWDNLGATLWTAEKKGDKTAAKALIAWRLVYMCSKIARKPDSAIQPLTQLRHEMAAQSVYPPQLTAGNPSPAYVGQHGRAHATRPEAHVPEAYPSLPLRPIHNQGLPTLPDAPAPEKPHRPEALARPKAFAQSVAYRQLSVRTSRMQHHITHTQTSPPKPIHPPTYATPVGENLTEADSERELHALPLIDLKEITQDCADTCIHDTSAPRPNTFTLKASGNVHALPASTTTQVEVAHNIIEAQEKAWKTIHEQAALAGDLEMLKAFPVQIEGGRPPQWRPISYPVLKDIKKTIVEHDLSSPYTLSLLESFFQAFDLTPNDIRQVASAWLPTLQYSAFEAEWKALIKKHVKEGDYVPISRDITQDKAIDRMYGEGAYVTNAKQAMTPLPVLHKSAELAFEAIKKVAKTSTSTPSYALIFQGPKEPFYDFASRLKEAVAKQISDPKAQEVLFKSLVVEKANEECRKILRPLKNPTLLEMIEACSNVDYAKKDLELMACAVKGRCFNCGKEGHLDRHCPENQPPPSPKTLPKYNCQRCGKGKHWTLLCRSVTDLNGD
ncbi:hypothetical protein WISP_41675 [Willisornis vidua]|uniref:CCHC-type domain-containing protein n=1 Tax=Willisornis vidua TaxID=1566151 RepID=A0ABQ9DL78_9PASS|nr:hypothetical protein WISP_41675 [Willisornis vidua]